MNILQMSVQASVMIAFIVMIRALSMGRLPKWSFQALWGMALLRLLLPVSIESPLSAYGALDAVRATLASPPPPIVVQQPIYLSAQAAPVVEHVVEQAAQAPGLTISPWLLAWLVGALGLAGFFLFTHIRCRKIYAQSLPLKAIYERGRAISVRASDRVGAPLTYGVLHPVILLPKRLPLGEGELQYVLAHEFAHIRQFDALKKWLLTLALCVHWFNPLVWVMFILANRDIELSCDESVLSKLQSDARVSYASMLIDLMERREGGMMPLASHFSRNATEERIVSIMKHKKASLLGVILALALVAFTATALATSAAPASTTIDPVQEAVSYPTQSDYAQTMAELYARYVPFGMTYNETDARLYFNGELVRCFEDMYPVGDGGSSGISSSHPDGAVDVRAVRDLSQKRYNADGSYDPSGVLIGLERAPQTEFDARTAELAAQPRVPTATSSNDTVGESATPHIMAASSTTYSGDSAEQYEDLYAIYAPYGMTYDAATDQLYMNGQLVRYFLDVLESNGESLTSGKFQGTLRNKSNERGTVDVYAVRDANDNLTGLRVASQQEFSERTKTWADEHADWCVQTTTEDGIEWWTADEFEAWLNEQREELPKMIGSRSWNQRDGWFTWTQADVDEMIAMYENWLADIRRGAHYSKNGDLAQDIGAAGMEIIQSHVAYASSDTDTASVNTLLSGDIIGDIKFFASAGETVAEAVNDDQLPLSGMSKPSAVVEVGWTKLDYNAIASAYSIIAFDDIVPSGGVKDGTLYSIQSGVDRLAFQITWAHPDSAVWVGLLSEDGGTMYAARLQGGIASGAISTEKIPSGKYYVALQVPKGSGAKVEGAISFCWI